MLQIDGALGEGGGQIVRSALALSAVTGRPFQMRRIRAARAKPGLRRQHLTAVQAAATICRAEIHGAEVGSLELTFRPGRPVAGNYRFDIGSAGSTTLVLQTLLPPLLMADGVSHLSLRGGTHNPLAPTFEFLAEAFLPLLVRMGADLQLSLIRYGFYPAGGGQIDVQLTPCSRLQRLELPTRGPLQRRWIRALSARLPAHIVRRECQTILSDPAWSDAQVIRDDAVDSVGPGNVVLIGLDFAHVSEVFTGFGRLGVRAEAVAGEALAQAADYLASGVAVGPHLADQLLLPLGMSAHFAGGGGTFQTMPLTQHATTQINVLRQFLEIDVQVTPSGRAVDVTVGPAAVDNMV